jgi:hypothetical protein
MLLAAVVLQVARSPLDAVYHGSVIVVLAAGFGYEALRRRRLSQRDRPSDSDSDSEPEG